MESSFEKQKVIDDVYNMSETPLLDRISELPDSVLLHILSFINTKYVVQMSILSKRWRYLWTSMPTLDIDDNLFFPYEILRNRCSVESMRFVGFVYKVMLFHDSHVQRFRLSLKSYDIYLSSWINLAIRKNVQELYINISNNYQIIKLPDCLFTCKSLVSLELNLRSSELILPTSICFPRLRTLHLYSVKFPRKSFGKLVRSCPVLEILIIETYQWCDEKVVDLSSPTLRNLFIIYSIGGIEGPTFKIYIPNLMSLKYIDSSAENFHFLDNHLSLVDAFIGIMDASGDQMIRLLRGVSNARCLTLSNFTLEEPSDASKILASHPTFHKLNKLILTGARTNHFSVIACLLRIFPKLESLIIDIEPYFDDDDELYEQIIEEPINGKESKEEPINGKESKELFELFLEDLLLDHLKVFQIRCFEGTEFELEFVKLVLRSASTMERLIITISGREFNKKTEICEKLLMFQRASKSCIFSLS